MGGSAPTGRSPRERQIALVKTKTTPSFRQWEIRTQVTPDIGPTGIRHFKLEMIRRALASQVETHFESLGQDAWEIAPDDDKSATSVEVIIEAERRLAVIVGRGLKAPFCLTRGHHLPSTEIIKQREKGMKGE
jgi:hypothetical protein